MSRADTPEILIPAIATNAQYVANLDKAAKKKPLTKAQEKSRASAVAKLNDYVRRYTALIGGGTTAPPVTTPTFEIPTDVPTGWNFQGLGEDADEGSTYLFGGSPGNPDGVDFTEGNARRWWQIVFTNRVNYSKVRPTLLPGGHVLSDEGYVAAENVTKDPTSWVAPADWNPLGLPVKP